MKYYIAKIVDAPFDEAKAKMIESLAAEGFGVLSEIDVSQTLKAKLNVEFPRYVILGACNPKLAHQALKAEERVGVMLPCNIVLRELQNDGVEIAAIDPTAAMAIIGNPSLEKIADQARERLRRVVGAF
ncbi:DUF302 domain-containing protein [Amphiplicatus metriothermophilus]|uniref:Uncharacterized conserved protein, DUF302 family n=1 Tax=Amphiplicatus metriothermophilus TaxID=1519374 RepID=A0A239PQ24_9PROT|nr:DUF302 domain-containing protein [Amphiplicatus metriothermophilus]MBB5518454.1 uncharacterized protein (DUF302 family) [Amphiplicatus metriothermophilus]SNT72384.1 Uncharacterized conserved protein, DUF302 family [Amphiplicatus metriothermophilus]